MHYRQNADRWKVCCTIAPKEEIVYCCQLIVALVVIVTSLVNITLGSGDTCLWTTLVSGALGYLLPNPSLKQNEPFLSDTAVECVDGVLSEEHGGEVHDETI